MPLEDDLKISQKIANYKPYEELLPDYQVTIDFTREDTGHQSSLVKMLKKSKLDYIESYIGQLEDRVLEDAKVNRDVLLKVMKKYYTAVEK